MARDVTRHPKPYGCGKRNLPSRKAAKRFIRARNDQTGNRPYKCPDCPFWHTTSADADSRRYFRERRDRP